MRRTVSHHHLHSPVSRAVLVGVVRHQRPARTVATNFKTGRGKPDDVYQVMGNDGRVVIAGHTDDRPIYNMLYRSNWELSSARAVTVAHHLIDVVGLPPTRLEVSGYGASRPLVPNDSDKNRATNRRVEVVMTDGPTQARKPPGLRNSKDGRHYEG